MAPTAPWESDNDALNALTQQLTASRVERSALADQIKRTDEDARSMKRLREDAEAKMREEEVRSREYEERANKALEDLKRERELNKALEDALQRAKDEIAESAKASQYLQYELTTVSSANQASLTVERAAYEKEIKQLKRQLAASATSKRPSSSAAEAKLQARILDLENRILDLQRENKDLLENHPPTTASAAAPSSGAEKELATLQAKFSKAQKDLITAQNDAQAAEHRARRQKQEMQDLLDAKDDELAELRYMLEQQQADEDLRAQLAEKDAKLRAIRDGISRVEGRITSTVAEVEQGMENRRVRAATFTATSAHASTPSIPPVPSMPFGESHVSLKRKISELETALAEKTALLAARPPAPSAQNSSSLDERPIRPLARSTTRTATGVSQEDYDALTEQCLGLEVEIEDRDAALEEEKSRSNRMEAELKSMKTTLEDHKSSQADYQLQLSTAQRELTHTKQQLEASDAQVTDLSSQLSSLQSRVSLGRSSGLSDAELANLMTTVGRLRGERDDAARQLAFIQAEAEADVNAAGEQVKQVEAEMLRLTQSLADQKQQVDTMQQEVVNLQLQLAEAEEALDEFGSRLSAAESSNSALTIQVEEAELQRRQSEITVFAHALTVQYLSSERDNAVQEWHETRDQVDEYAEAHHRMMEALDIERERVADLTQKLEREMEARGVAVGIDDIYDATGTFDVDELATREHHINPLSSDIQFTEPEVYDSFTESQFGVPDVDTSHVLEPVEEEDPSFLEAMLEFDPNPPSPAGTTRSSNTIASSRGALPTSQAHPTSQSSKHDSRSHSHPRPHSLQHSSVSQYSPATSYTHRPHSHHSNRSNRSGHLISTLPPMLPPIDPDNLHASCHAQIRELEDRIMRRNEQIGKHQHEIEALNTNLFLAEDALRERESDWEQARADAAQMALERDAMIADCAEARETRDEAIMRAEKLDEEVEELKADVLRAQDQLDVAEAEAGLLSASTSSTPATSGYSDDQVAALVETLFDSLQRTRVAQGAFQEIQASLSDAYDLEQRLADAESAREFHAFEADERQRENEALAQDLEAMQAQLEELRDASTAAEAQAATSLRELNTIRNELQDVQDEQIGERQRHASILEGLQQQLADAQADKAAAQRSADSEIQRLHAEAQASQDAFADLEAQHQQLQDSVAEAEARDHEAHKDIIAEYEIRLQNAAAAKESIERALQEAADTHEADLSQLSARCEELEAELAAAGQAAQDEVDAVLVLRQEHDRDLAKAIDARNVAVSRADDAEQLLDLKLKLLGQAEAAVSELKSQLSQRTNDYHLAEARLRNALDNEARTVASRNEMQAKLEDLKRISGMKRFVEMDLKKRENELAALKREHADTKKQLEAARQRAGTIDIVHSTERVRLTKEAADLRLELDAAAAAQERLVTELAESEEKIKSLARTQRKNEVHIHLLKEKLRTVPVTKAQQPAPARDPVPAPSVPASSQAPPEVPSAAWRKDPNRPIIRPRNVSASASGPGAASGSRPPPQPRQRQPLLFSNDPVDTKRDHISPRSASAPSAQPAPTLLSPSNPASASAVTGPQGESIFAGAGKRKRVTDDDAENRRPPDAIVVPPSSPSRIRQLAERGLRTIVRSPTKRFSELPDEEENPRVPISIANPYAMAGDQPDLSTKPFIAPPQHAQEQESKPIERPARRSSLRRIRISEIMSTATNRGR
ncbi:hypothetical protein DL93DRAFT_2157815 [Clavulina sp. PMI_390]|nr:hypothetical protein DL93DRAFT_2157815 [Clavulina sp. PMI_390]